MKSTFKIFSVIIFVIFIICPTQAIDFDQVFFTSTQKNTNTGKTWNIYIDSDRSNHFESAQSIERGVKLAFSEVGNNLQGRKIKFVVLNHGGNTVRVEKHLHDFLKDPSALVYYGGLHSPPLIQLKDFINDNQLLTLVPWAAGAPITRASNNDNYIFRLSIDDSKAGGVISKFAVNNLGCTEPHLLLEDTTWGDSNLKNMTQALRNLGKDTIGVTRFGWNLGSIGAKMKLNDIIKQGADCIQLVANSVEGAKFSEAMLSLPESQRLPIISHWGIIGGDYYKKIDAGKRRGLNLHFIQTCFSFTNAKQTKFTNSVFGRARELFADIKLVEDLKAPTGFIHAYDISRLFIDASNNIKLTDDVVANRLALKNSLESLNQPVQGLVKRYQKPFGSYTKSKPDAHEALTLDNYCMAYFGTQDQIIVLENN